MWKQVLASYLKPEVYRYLKLAVFAENTFYEHLLAIRVILAENGYRIQAAYLFVGIVEQMFKQCMSKQFYFDFAPVDQHWEHRCSRCGNFFSRHIKLLSCGHLVCNSCVRECDWEKLECPACSRSVEDITIDTRVFKEQLEAMVYCIHATDSRYVEYLVYSYTEADLEDLELQQLAVDFNENRVNIGPLNALRNTLLSAEISDRVIDGITGSNRPIELFDYQEQFVSETLEACAWVGRYKDLPNHLQNACDHCVKTCSNFQCAYYTNQCFINEHLLTCIHRQVQCPICYETITKNLMQSHVVECLSRLSKLISNISSIPDDFFIDVDLELKFRALNMKMDNLVSLIVRWDNSCQREVVQDQEDFDAPQSKHLLNKRLNNAMRYIYETHLSKFTIVFGFIMLTILDICYYTAPLVYRYYALALSIIAFANLFFFLLYVANFVISNKFRSALASYMFSAFYAGIFNCAVLFTMLEFYDPDNISTGLRAPLPMFFDMLYFSGITGACIGLGDIVPKSGVLKMLTVAEICYTQLICRIVFRGLSFFCKMHDFEQMKHKYTKEDLLNL